jgi:sortase A
MRKSFFGLVFFSIILGVILGLNFNGPKQENKTNQIPVQASPSVSTTQAVKSFYPPEKLIINKLNINANVESVGLDSQKRMDVPKIAANVGWYNLGFKAGEKGSVVLAGHFDDVNGDPAVFYNLGNLDIGDEIEITDENNNSFKYKVIDKQVYDFDKLPLNDIFASTDKKRLNLITCNGVFSQSEKNYSKRLVVYSEAIN